MAKLTTAVWALCQTDYEKGKSMSALSRQYDVSRQAIMKKRDKETWQKPEAKVTPCKQCKAWKNKAWSIHKTFMAYKKQVIKSDAALKQKYRRELDDQSWMIYGLMMATMFALLLFAIVFFLNSSSPIHY